MKDDTTRILNSGWGAFLAISLVLSVAIDIANPTYSLAQGEKFHIFGTGSAILGWLVSVGIFVLPSGLLRRFGIAPVNWWIAIFVCLVGYVVWMLLTLDDSRTRQRPPSLTLMASIFLGWRLLRLPRLPLAKTDHSPEKLEPTIPLTEFSEPPSNPGDERTIPIVSMASPEKLASSNPLPIGQLKTRLVLAGLLVILVGFGIHSWVKDDSPSLAWLLISGGIWSISAHLAPSLWIDLILRQMTWKVVRRRMGYAMVVAVSLIALWALIAGIAAALEWAERNAQNEIGGTKPIEEEDALRVYLSMDSLDVATKARAERLLADYRAQQKRAGLPMFPNLAAQPLNLATAGLMLIDWDAWEKSLDASKRAHLVSAFEYETEESLPAAKRRFASVAYVSVATGADIQDVSLRFEEWYMPAFAKDEKVGLGKAEGVRNFGEFFDLLVQLVARKNSQ